MAAAPNTVLLHFVATWANAICEPHRREARRAAAGLLLEYREADVDESPELVLAYRVLNVPAVALDGDLTNPPIVGAHLASWLIDRLRARL